jgi:uncharacterized protein with HEPN domain
MKKDPTIFLEHILECIELIEKYVLDLSKEEFSKSTQIQDSVTRRLEVIGEATKHLLDEFKEYHQDIPWAKILAMRNMLIHEYFAVNLDVVWKTVKEDIPELKNHVLKILKDYK